MAGILDGLMGGSGGQGVGLLGLLSDPMRQAHLAMILKGLSPHSGIDPQQMMAQAQRVKLLQQERLRDDQRRIEDIKLKREFHADTLKQQDRQYGLQEDKLGRMEALDKYKQDRFDAQQRSNSDLDAAIGGAESGGDAPPPMAPVPSVPYVQGGLSDTLGGNTGADALAGGDASGAQEALKTQIRSLEEAIRRNSGASPESVRAARAHLDKLRSQVGVPEGYDPKTYREQTTKRGMDRADEERAKQEAQPQKQREVNITNELMDTAIETSKNKGGALPTTGAIGGQLLSNIGGTAARDTHIALRSVKSRVSIDIMKKMKELSSQGASGFGSLAIKELEALESNLGALDQSVSSPELFAKNMEAVRENYNTLMGMTPTTMGAVPGSASASDKPTISKQEAIEELKRRGKLK